MSTRSTWEPPGTSVSGRGADEVHVVETRSGGQLAQGLADRHLARGRHLVQTVDQDLDHGFLHGSEAAERAEHVALERVEPAPLVLGQRAR